MGWIETSISIRKLWRPHGGDDDDDVKFNYVSFQEILNRGLTSD